MMCEISRKKIVRPNKLLYNATKACFTWGYKHLAKPAVEFREDLEKLKKEKGVFLYVGLHKSLWETSGVLLCLGMEGLPIPYIGMGDNLVRGRFFQSLTQKTGIFLIKRPQSRKEILESARMLKNTLINFMAHGIDVLVFPEGTRRNIPGTGQYGKFFPTVFDALLEYEKNKEKILEENRELSAYTPYVVPFNVDYSKVREDVEMIKNTAGVPRTLHILDSLKMIKNIGDTYIEFGKPLKIGENLDKGRKDLADYSRQRCLELVKILPINIVALSILDSFQPGGTEPVQLENRIRDNIQKLAGFQDRFRGFDPGEAPGDILARVSRQHTCFKHIHPNRSAIYRMYAGYIHHYLEEPGI